MTNPSYSSVVASKIARLGTRGQYTDITMTDDRTLFIRPPVWLPIIVVFIGGLFYLQGKNMEARYQDPAMIIVTGEGKVQGAPTIATLNFGVTTGPQKAAKDAMQKLTTEMNAVLDAVKKLGIDVKDITTQQLSLSPQYDWSNGNQTLRGYEATQSLMVKVHDLDKVGTILSAATNAGANQAGGVDFTIDQPESLRAQAREQAIEQAKEKAQTLAKQLGMSLGKVRSFNEGSAVMPPVPMMYAKDMASGMGGGGSIDVPSGQQDVTVQVSITYELK